MYRQSHIRDNKEKEYKLLLLCANLKVKNGRVSFFSFNSDTDSDGLSDSKELFEYHTDPLNFDTDGDGISDGKEVQIKRNPHLPGT